VNEHLSEKLNENLSFVVAFYLRTNKIMKTGDSLKTTKLIRSQKTGVLLPRQGTFVRDIENLGRKLILVDFGSVGEEYLFPNEILDETCNG